MNKLLELLMNNLARIMNKFTPSCDAITLKISRTLDNSISLKDRLAIRFHVIFCKFCRRYEKQISGLHNYLLRNASKYDDITEDDSIQLSEDIRLKIKKRIKEENID